MHIIPDDIKSFILIGSAETACENSFYSYFEGRDFLNCLGPDTWLTVTVNLSNGDLINLFKGLVSVERALKWTGGSVAGAIWVYKIIDQRQLDRDYLIAGFGLENGDNTYVPFGNSYHGKRTIKDYFA